MTGTISPSDTVRRVLWTFVQAFIAGFLTLAVGIGAAQNWSDLRAATVAAILAGIAAGLSALKNLTVKGAAR